MRIVAVVPAKGESERLPNKNVAVLDGEYLFKRKLRQLLACPRITEVYLDTESDKLAGLAADLPVRRLRRPAALATNATDGHKMFAWAASQIPAADIYIQALCTAPFIDQDTIDRALDALMASPEADSLLAVRSQKLYAWREGEPTYGGGRIPNSVDLPSVTAEAMSLYMVRRPEEAPSPSRRFGTSPLLFEVTEVEDVDIDTPEDLEFAELIAAGQRAASNARVAALKPHLTSSLLSDLCADKGLTAVLPSYLRPTSCGKILGRAKTLKLASLESGRGPDEWQGIYRALDSYAFVRPGDVIIASTDVPERAYFGELNATIALRAGAVGAIIDGFTRDTREVQALAFPTYARGSYCFDIMYEGTLETMNAPIEIGDVTIRNNDVVFADDDGVVVIPSAAWPEIQDLAIEAMLREAQIRAAIIRGMPIEAILRDSGPF